MNSTAQSSPFDKCSSERARYHVVDSAGFIRVKSDRRANAMLRAWQRSIADQKATLAVIDTVSGDLLETFVDGEAL